MTPAIHYVNKETGQVAYRWPAAFTATLKRMWLEGKSAGEISKVLGPPFSRSAVMGKVNRLKLERRPAAPPPAPVVPATVERITTVTLPKVALSPVYPIDKVPMGPGGGLSEAPDGPVTLMQLTGRHCHHPLWTHFERPNVHTSLYCGGPVIPGRIYCETHAGGNYEKPHDRA